MKLVYWVADILVDHPCYSIRAKTKEEVLDVLSDADASIFSEPREVVVEYEDAFDLMQQCVCEHGLLAEGSAWINGRRLIRSMCNTGSESQQAAASGLRYSV